MSVLTLVFVVLLFGRGLVLISEPQLAVQVMGFAILVLPLFAIWSIFVELRFGFRAQKLARLLTEQGFPELEVELRPSGKATRESAASEFIRISSEIQARESWELWFRLGEAYDANGDRKRARQSIRRAIALANNSESAKP